MPTILLARRERNYKPKPENTRVYNSKRWKKLRTAKFRDSPMCELCLEVGRTKQADVIHHKVPWQTGRTEDEKYDLIIDYDNLQSLCHTCHSEIHHKLRLSASYEGKQKG